MWKKSLKEVLHLDLRQEALRENKVSALPGKARALGFPALLLGHRFATSGSVL